LSREPRASARLRLNYGRGFGNHGPGATPSGHLMARSAVDDAEDYWFARRGWLDEDFPTACSSGRALSRRRSFAPASRRLQLRRDCRCTACRMWGRPGRPGRSRACHGAALASRAAGSLVKVRKLGRQFPVGGDVEHEPAAEGVQPFGTRVSFRPGAFGPTPTGRGWPDCSGGHPASTAVKTARHAAANGLTTSLEARMGLSLPIPRP